MTSYLESTPCVDPVYVDQVDPLIVEPFRDRDTVVATDRVYIIVYSVY